MQPAKYSNILLAFMKIELCQFTFGAIHFERFQRKEGVGRGCVRSAARAQGAPIERDNTIRQCGPSAGVSFVAGLFPLDSHTLWFLPFVHISDAQSFGARQEALVPSVSIHKDLRHLWAHSPVQPSRSWNSWLARHGASSVSSLTR